MTSFVGCAFFASSAATAAADYFPLPWTTPNQHALNRMPDLVEMTARELATDVAEFNGEPISVGEAHFIDIDGDGHLELVATVDASGRAFFVNIHFVTRDHARYRFSRIAGNGIPVTGLQAHFRDVDGDGTQEFLMKDFIHRYEGAMRAPTELRILRWRAGRYVDRSAAFPTISGAKSCRRRRRKSPPTPAWSIDPAGDQTTTTSS